MAYSALIVESDIHHRKASSPESKGGRSIAPTDLLASPWLSHCSYYRASKGLGGSTHLIEPPVQVFMEACHQSQLLWNVIHTYILCGMEEFIPGTLVVIDGPHS